jgi:hypothetical protein
MVVILPDRRVVTNIHPVTGEAGEANGNSSWSAKMSPTSTDRITLTGSQRRELTRMTGPGALSNGS